MVKEFSQRMLPFFVLAGRSPTRQYLWRWMICLHFFVLISAAFVPTSFRRGELIGHALLLVSIVEAAILIGWRLAQWPKHQAIELLLTSPLSGPACIAAELLIGTVQMLFLTVASLPIFMLLKFTTPIRTRSDQQLLVETINPLIIPFSMMWGLTLGMGIVWWAYERREVRRVLEKISMAGVLTFIIGGAMIGKQSIALLNRMPDLPAKIIQTVLGLTYDLNPFVVIQHIHFPYAELAPKHAVMSGLVSLGMLAFFCLRILFRLKPHYIDYHYGPGRGKLQGKRGTIGDWPLTWHAVRRVSRYSGLANVYLAGGFSLLFSGMLIVGPANWPTWAGRDVLLMFEQIFGVTGIMTGLVLLAAVPAAYQFGLWDPSPTERLKKLELLLLTDLQPRDFLAASWSASAHRGGWYLSFALILLAAGNWAGRFTPMQATLILMAMIGLIGLYFAIGFYFLARTTSTLVGMTLCVVFPALTYFDMTRSGGSLGQFLPTGTLTGAIQNPTWLLAGIVILQASVAIGLLIHATRQLDTQLRQWYSSAKTL